MMATAMSHVMDEATVTGQVQWIVVIMLAVVVLTMAIVMASRYKRCGPNQILVISGKTATGDMEWTDGGARFVWPVIQDYAYLSTEPFGASVRLEGAVTADKAPVDVAMDLTVAVCPEQEFVEQASQRLLGLSEEQQRALVEAGALASVRELVGGLEAVQMASDRQAFAARVREAAAKELAKLGLAIVTVDVSPVTIRQT
jgi:flotillin